MAEMSKLRKEMVDRQLAARGIQDPDVLRAMAEVPREVFVPGHLRHLAYTDSPLPIGEEQTISQPYIVALMTEAMEVSDRDRVLEIGTGSGYAAAVLSRIAAEVYTVERHGTLARAARRKFEELGYDNVHVRHGDGTLGWAAHAPYDATVVTAGGPQVPEPLLEQLAIGGCLVIPVGPSHYSQELVRIRRTSEADYHRENLGAVRFVPLVGSEGWEA
jgi:protein-L-isoaspartate(D-aspartate) O-methyltransferase